MTRSKQRQLVLRWILVAFGTSATADPAVTQCPDLSGSIVRIIATETRGTSSRTGTGFLWQDRQTVVTCYHLIAGADGGVSAIAAPFQLDLDKRIPARVLRYNRDYDLAILRLDAEAGSQPLTTIAIPESNNDQLYAFGFPGNIARPDGEPLTCREIHATQSPLRDFLFHSAILRLDACSIPSLDVGMLNLVGNLVRGHSGAPIVNRSRGLVGIADGGMAGGTIGRCWGIPADVLMSTSGWASGVPPPLTTECMKILFSDRLDVGYDGTARFQIRRAAPLISTRLDWEYVSSAFPKFAKFLQEGDDAAERGSLAQAEEKFRLAERAAAGESALRAMASSRLGDVACVRGGRESEPVKVVPYYNTAIRLYQSALSERTGDMRDRNGVSIKAWCLYQTAWAHSRVSLYFADRARERGANTDMEKNRLRHDGEARAAKQQLAALFPTERNKEGEALIQKLSKFVPDRK